MYIRPESPAEVFVKHSITKTRGFEDDKCVPKESVIGSGIKGLSCLWRETGRRWTDREWKKEKDGLKGGRGTVNECQIAQAGDRVAEWVGFDRHISHRLTAPSIAPGWPCWLTASRWRMNGVVRRTVSQSHIAVATRPRLNRHTAAQGDLWIYRQTFGTGGWGSSDHHAKINTHVDSSIQ